MGQSSKATPNTRLGEVTWWCDEFFGTMLFVCQGMLGMGAQKADDKFLNTHRLSIGDLWEYFEERKLPNGMLCLDLYMDQSWHTCVLATIETTIPYEEDIGDQTFLNLIADFKDHVRALPLCNPDKREGALWTDEDIERGYCEASAKLHADAFRQLDEALAQSAESLRTKTDDEREEK